MRNYSFTKMNGAGNDFIMLDEIQNPGLELDPATIAQMCDRRFGIGADGVITIGNSEKADFGMQYYNADGSTGSLCGNGSRCALMFFYKMHKPGKQELKFHSLGKEYHGEILDETSVKFFLGDPGKIKLGFKLKVNDQLFTAHYADTGSPHVVINIADVLENPKIHDSFYRELEHFPVEEVGKIVRWLPEFQPGGVNVNFFQLRNGEVFIRTFERGVEAETFACGTGATATAIIAHLTAKVAPPVSLETKSGRILSVDFIKSGTELVKLSLTGPAEINYNGSITI